MLKEIDNHLSDIKKISIKSSDELEKFRIKYISKKGIVPSLFQNLKMLIVINESLDLRLMN